MRDRPFVGRKREAKLLLQRSLIVFPSENIPSVLVIRMACKTPKQCHFKGIQAQP